MSNQINNTGSGIPSSRMNYANYSAQLGACRPSAKNGPNPWQDKGYKTIDQCKLECDNDGRCKAFDVARPRNGLYECFLHYNNGIAGNQNIKGCRAQDDCSCYVKGSSFLQGPTQFGFNNTGQNTRTVITRTSTTVNPSDNGANRILPIASNFNGYTSNTGICRPANRMSVEWNEQPGETTHIQGQSADQCRAACDSDANCGGFDHVNIDSAGFGECALHHYGPVKTLSPDAEPMNFYCGENNDTCKCYSKTNIKSSVVSPLPAAPGNSLAAYSNYDGAAGICRPTDRMSINWNEQPGEVTHVESQTSDQCKALCDSSATCGGFDMTNLTNGVGLCSMHNYSGVTNLGPSEDDMSVYCGGDNSKCQCYIKF